MARKAGIKDIAFSAMPQVSSALANLAIAVLLARTLGPEALGSYALIISVSGLITVLSEAGLNQAALKFASHAAARGCQDERHGVLRWALQVRLIIWLVAALLALTLLPWATEQVWKAPELRRLFSWSLLIPLFAALSAMPTLYYQSGRSFGKSAVIATLQSLITLCAVALLAVMGYFSLQNVVYATIFSAAVHALIATASIPNALLWPLEPWRRRREPSGAAATAVPETAHGSRKQGSQGHFAVLMTAASLVVMVTTRLDVWLLGYFVGKDAVGVYTVAFRATLPLSIGLAAVNTALWPRASSLDQRSDVYALLERIWRPVLKAASAGCLYAILAPLLIPVVFGAAFADAVFLSQLLCLRFCIAIIVCPLGVVGYSLGLVGHYLVVNLIQLVAVLAIMAVLMPFWGAYAAAMALLVNELIGAVLIGAYIRRMLRK